MACIDCHSRIEGKNVKKCKNIVEYSVKHREQQLLLSSRQTADRHARLEIHLLESDRILEQLFFSSPNLEDFTRCIIRGPTCSYTNSCAPAFEKHQQTGAYKSICVRRVT